MEPRAYRISLHQLWWGPTMCLTRQEDKLREMSSGWSVKEKCPQTNAMEVISQLKFSLPRCLYFVSSCQPKLWPFINPREGEQCVEDHLSAQVFSLLFRDHTRDLAQWGREDLLDLSESWSMNTNHWLEAPFINLTFLSSLCFSLTFEYSI